MKVGCAHACNAGVRRCQRRRKMLSDLTDGKLTRLRRALSLSLSDVSMSVNAILCVSRAQRQHWPRSPLAPPGRATLKHHARVACTPTCTLHAGPSVRVPRSPPLRIRSVGALSACLLGHDGGLPAEESRTETEAGGRGEARESVRGGQCLLSALPCPSSLHQRLGPAPSSCSRARPAARGYPRWP